MNTATSVPERRSSCATGHGPRDVTVRLVDPTAEGDWDEKISNFEGFTFFHGSSWCRVLKETYGFRPCYVVAERNGKVCGLLPLMETDTWPKGRRGVSLPFTDQCPLLTAESEVDEDLMAAAMDEAARRAWGYMETRGGLKSWRGSQPSVSFYTHSLDLRSDETEMFERLYSAVQRAIRKAERSGLDVSVDTSLESVRDFYELHCRTRHKHGVPPQPFRFFRNIQRRVLECGRGAVVTARLGTRPIASAVFCHQNGKAIYKFAASDEKVQHLRGNNLVMWHGVRWLAGQGCSNLDLGRTSMGNEGLRRFKLGWGSSESHVDYCRYDLRRGAFVQSSDHSAGWQSRVFQVFPEPLCRVIGALAYGRLA